MLRLLVVGALSLAGCAGQVQAEAQTRLDAAVTACRTQHPAERGFYVVRFQCEEPARRAYGQRVGAAPDLTNVYLASRASLAGQLDRGEVTREQANLQIAQLERELTEATLRRRNAALAAQPPVILAPAAALTPAPAGITECTRSFGGSVECISR